MQPLPTQFWDLLLIQLTNWRWSWRSHLLLSTIAPLLSTIAFGVFVANDGQESRSTILIGSVVMSLLFGIVGQISSHFAFIRHTGQLDFFATLPITRLAFLLATVWAFFLISLPSALFTLLLGSAILQVRLNIHIVIIVVLPVMSVSLCGLGVLIGLLNRSIHEAGMMMNLVNFLLVGPVLIPRALLPEWLGIATLLSPANYAADALRQVALDAPPLLPLSLNLVVLIATGAGLLWLATRWIDWRR